jgi:hypothetical protein
MVEINNEILEKIVYNNDKKDLDFPNEMIII